MSLQLEDPSSHRTVRPLLRCLTAAAAALVVIAVMAVAVPPAEANTLYRCKLRLTGDAPRACTVITGGPVDVYDRQTDQIIQLDNGASVVLNWWAKDRSGLCGVNGDPYVWSVSWDHNQHEMHTVVIGDYYLATGSVSQWNWFTDVWGNLGNDKHYRGVGYGTCDVFSPVRNTNQHIKPTP